MAGFEPVRTLGDLMTLDGIDLFLLRVGMMDDGAMADDQPFTDLGEDMRDRCEGLVSLGFLKFTGCDHLGLIRHYRTTVAGVARVGAH